MARLSIYEKAKKQRTAYLKQNQVANYEFILEMKSEIASLGNRLKEIRKSPMHAYEDDIYYDFDKLRLMVAEQSRRCLTREPGRHKDTNPNPKWRREITRLRDDVVEDIAYLESISSCAIVNSEAMKTEGTFTIVAD